MSATVGFRIPDGLNMTENNPGQTVTSESLFAGKKVVLFGVPGAFTPGCSKTHLPGYVADSDALKAKGIDDIICITVNDAFVAGEWGRNQGCEGKVRIIADHNAELTKALGLELDLTGPFGLGGLRCKRFSSIVDNGIITHMNVEPDGTGMKCSLAPSLLMQLSAL
jgi:2-Cys peroxiredoxin 5